MTTIRFRIVDRPVWTTLRRKPTLGNGQGTMWLPVITSALNSAADIFRERQQTTTWKSHAKAGHLLYRDGWATEVLGTYSSMVRRLRSG